MLNKSKIRIYAFRLLIGVLCVFPVYQWFFLPLKSALNHMARAPDAENANKLYNYITNQIDFEQKSLFDSNRPAISIHPSNHGLRFDVYGLTNSDVKKDCWQLPMTGNLQTITLKISKFDSLPKNNQEANMVSTLNR